MNITFDVSSVEDYARFLRVKQLPQYRIQGRSAWFPDEYASLLGVEAEPEADDGYEAPSWMFDYQRAITAIAIKKRRFALFWDCGLGKTATILEFARVARDDLRRSDRGVLIVSPLMVVPQTMREAAKFYGDGNYDIEPVKSSELADWCRSCGGKIGITNYDAFSGHDYDRGKVGALILDESSMLKSHYGKWATRLLAWGAGLKWKLCATGTPAPNDRIEYANHAVFLGQFPSVNSFLATYFVNRGQTQERWVLKPHALRPFYRALSHWCVFLTDPSVYGWHDNCDNIPPIHVHIESVDMTDEQQRLARQHTGELFANTMGGITGRARLGQIGKGFFKGAKIASNKTAHIKALLESWPDESTLVWCKYNAEQDDLANYLPGAASISGATKLDERFRLIDGFLSGDIRTLITKPKILGFGLNLQIATRQIFSGLEDSFETYYQAVKRSNRYGSTRPLNVHIPVTDIEEPLVQNVLRKAHRVEADTREQELLFREAAVYQQ